MCERSVCERVSEMSVCEISMCDEMCVMRCVCVRDELCVR